MQRQAIIVSVVALMETFGVMCLPSPLFEVGIYIAGVTGLVGFSMLVGFTSLMAKTADGHIPIWSTIALWPWHLVARGAAWVTRKTEPLTTEIHPGWYVGGWPHRSDLWEEWPAVLDVTCELPRQHRAPYLCLPTWDGMAPTAEQIEAGVSWALAERERQNPVLIHCAAGHARSVTVLVACLHAAGLYPTWEEAFLHVKGLRPTVRINPDQRAALREWVQLRAAQQ